MPLGLSPPTCVNAAVSSSISDFSYNTPPVAPWPATDGGRVGGEGWMEGGRGGGVEKGSGGRERVLGERRVWRVDGLGWVGVGWGGGGCGWG